MSPKPWPYRRLYDSRGNGPDLWSLLGRAADAVRGMVPLLIGAS